MDKLKEKLANLRSEADNANLKAEQVETELRDIDKIISEKGISYSYYIFIMLCRCPDFINEEQVYVDGS